MGKDLNLAELLKDVPEGTKLYSPICGDCKLIKVHTDSIIVVSADCLRTMFNIDGTFQEGGECLLFPSKDNRDWSMFKVEKDGFKVGDYVKEKDSDNVFKIKEQDNYLVTLTTILADSSEIERTISTAILDRYEKVEKFDPKWLKPFDRVLVRDSLEETWDASFFSCLTDGGYPYSTINRCIYEFCIPYTEETKHLVGTADEEPEFYKID